MKFYQGLEIQYKELQGKVNFISSQYITMTLDRNNTDVLIYPEQWDEIQLMTGNRQEEK